MSELHITTWMSAISLGTERHSKVATNIRPGSMETERDPVLGGGER